MYNLSIFKDNNFLDLSCRQIGFEKCIKHHHYGPVARGHFLFHFIVEGEGTLLYRNSDDQDVTLNLKKGNGFLLSPNQVSTYFASESNPWHYYWIELEGMQVRNIFETIGLTYDHPIFNSRSHNSFKKTESLFREFLKKSSEPDELFIQGQSYSILSMLLQDSESAVKQTKNKKQNALNPVVQYIKENYSKLSNVQQICERFNVSNNHLSSMFKKEYGVTLNRFLTEFKMRKAQQLLLESDIHISELSDLLNYSNQFNFSRAFKNETGLSPNQWREENKISTQNSRLSH